MTKAELREAIKTEARVKTSTNFDDFIDSLIFEITRDHCNKARYSECLVLDAVIAPVNATGVYDLPADFQNIHELRFARGPVASYWHPVLPLNTLQRRRSIVGYPRNYIITGLQLNITPYDAILATDFLSLSYYADRMVVFSTDPDDEVFPIPRIESLVKKEVVARMQRVHLDFASGDRMGKDAASSFVAAQSSSL